MSLYIDTNVFLNVVYKEQRFKAKAAKLLRRIQSKEIQAVTSAVTLFEIIIDMTSSGFGENVEEAISAVEDLAGLSLVSLDTEMSKTAAKHVLSEGITVHDAYHLATALHSKAMAFVTRDERLRQKIGKYLQVLTPDEVV